MIFKEALTFDDVLIVPKFSTINSRKEVDLSGFTSNRAFRSFGASLPVISSNMDTVTGPDMAAAMLNYGAQACLHRFCTIEENVKMFEASMVPMGGSGSEILRPMVSIGLGNEELERARALYGHGAWSFVIDVAHGAQESVAKQAKALRAIVGQYGGIMVGNFAGADSVKHFLEYTGNGVVDAIKIGVGPGCFAAGTRILMSDGTYKNIEDVKLHDRVINKNGIAVNVCGTKFSGYRNVKKYKNVNFHKHSFATPDHLHWIGDHSTTKDIQKICIRKILDRPTKKDESKYKWAELQNCSNSIFLAPKNIKFELPESFSIEMGEFYESRRGFKEGFIEMKSIGPSYDLGYLIGTFLGDGSARLYSKRSSSENSRRNTSACSAWYFGLHEKDIAKKVSDCLYSIFQANSKIEDRKNVTVVLNQNNFLARFFLQFGKRQNKHLPNKYLCSDINYLKGIYEGLVDSDGHKTKDGRTGFHNTSVLLCELFMFLSSQINGYFPSCVINKPTLGGLKGGNIDNCKESYNLRTVKNPDWNLTKDYQICRVYEIEDTDLLLPTYDIEVDCDTHSFIANNVIVHNSACTTRIKTGAGYPQLSAILEISEAIKNTEVGIVADGGMKTPGDIAKALGAGAHMVMLGGMLAGTEETPGSLVNNQGQELTFLDNENIQYDEWVTHKNNVKVFKKYRGSASQESYESQGKTGGHRTAEGESFLVPYKGRVERVLQDIEGGLRSSFTYVGARNLKDFHSKVEFVRISNATRLENGAHGAK